MLDEIVIFDEPMDRIAMDDFLFTSFENRSVGQPVIRNSCFFIPRSWDLAWVHER
jgi:hypothetical protein